MIYENTPRLETERLILRKFTAQDALELLKILEDEEVNTFLPWFPIKHIEEAKVFLQEKFLNFYDKLSAYRYAICLKEDDLPIGYICLASNSSNDFGYGLRKEFWHKGIVSEAAQKVIEQIKNAGYDFITATHDINNPRSGEVMKKIGMIYKYSYVERCQPKNTIVTFKMYQLNFDDNQNRTYMEYWNKYENHFIDKN